MKILSLDDHPLFSNGLKESLSASDSSLKITSMHKAQEALVYLKNNSDVSLLILDLSMPEMSGISFMKTLIARGIYTPVVIMSAKEDLQIIQEAFELGALGFLPKSWSVKEIMDALKRLEKGELVIPKSIALGLDRVSKNAIENTQTLLSSRQLEILKVMATGLGNKDIASVLYISESTVKSHLQNIFQIFGAKNRMDCLRKAEHLNIIQKSNSL